MKFNYLNLEESDNSTPNFKTPSKDNQEDEDSDSMPDMANYEDSLDDDGPKLPNLAG